MTNLLIIFEKKNYKNDTKMIWNNKIIHFQKNIIYYLFPIFFIFFFLLMKNKGKCYFLISQNINIYILYDK